AQKIGSNPFEKDSRKTASRQKITWEVKHLDQSQVQTQSALQVNQIVQKTSSDLLVQNSENVNNQKNGWEDNQKECLSNKRQHAPEMEGSQKVQKIDKDLLEHHRELLSSKVKFFERVAKEMSAQGKEEALSFYKNLFCNGSFSE